MSPVMNLIHWWAYSSIPIVVGLTSIPILLWIYMLWIFNPKKIKQINVGLCVACIFAIGYITIFSKNPSGASRIDLIPFSFISRAEQTPTIYREYWMNVYLFIPFGMTISVFIEKEYWKAILIGACFSIFIESIQFFFALGLCEVDDVIANTLGCAIGVIIYMATMKCKQKFKQ